MAPDPNLKVMTAERREPLVSEGAPDKADHLANLARALLDEQHMAEQETGGFGRVAAGLLFVVIVIGVGIGAYAYFTGSIHPTFLARFF
jgi:hypothetical protein